MPYQGLTSASIRNPKFDSTNNFPFFFASSNILVTALLDYIVNTCRNSVTRDGFGPGPAQPKSAQAYIPTWPKAGPGPKAAQRKLAQIGLGPIFFGPGPAQKIVGPDEWPKTAQNDKIWPNFSVI